MSELDVFNQTHLDVLAINKNDPQSFCLYLGKFVANSVHGLMFRQSKNHRWLPVTKNEVKQFCGSNRKKFNDVMKTIHENVEVVLHPDHGDYLDSSGLHLKVNLWLGFAVDPIDVSFNDINSVVQPWLRMIHDVWCNRDDNLSQQVIQHFASIIQRPYQRTNKTIVLRTNSKPLVDIIFEPIKKILRPWNYANLEGKANITYSNNDNGDWTETLILVIHDQIPRPDIIKNIFDHDTLHIKYKGYKGFMIKNICNLFINSVTYQTPPQDTNHVILNLNDSNANANDVDFIRSINPAILLSFLNKIEI